MALEPLITDDQLFKKLVKKILEQQPTGFYLIAHDRVRPEAPLLEEKRNRLEFKKARFGRTGPALFIKQGDCDDLKSDLVNFPPEEYLRAVVEKGARRTGTPTPPGGTPTQTRKSDTQVLDSKAILASLKAHEVDDFVAKNGIGAALNEYGPQLIDDYVSDPSHEQHEYFVVACHKEDPHKIHEHALTASSVGKNAIFNLFEAVHPAGTFKDDRHPKDLNVRKNSLSEEGYEVRSFALRGEVYSPVV